MPRRALALQLAVLAALATLLAVTRAAVQEPELFPVPPARLEGDLQVSELHAIRYTVHGNPDGKPVFVLHGGPGFGAYPRLVQYFDPAKWRIVVHDPRGCGRSRPLGELRGNTTQELVADVERLRAHLGIEQPSVLFGGSWGSTLALAYAETHPERVAGMILRGVFLATRAEIESTFAGAAPRMFFPEAVARLEAALPPGVAEVSPESLAAIFAADDRETALRMAEAWARYSFTIVRLHTPPESLAEGFGDWDPLPSCRIDVHYMANACFLEEGRLLRDATRLAKIPVTIVNGRYDMLCPPAAAYRLHERLPGSKLVIVEEAGHSETEPGITRALLEAAASFE